MNPRVRDDRKLRESRRRTHGQLRALEPLHRLPRVDLFLRRDKADGDAERVKVKAVVPWRARPRERHSLRAFFEPDVEHRRVPRAQHPPLEVHEPRVGLVRHAALGSRGAEPLEHVAKRGDVFFVHAMRLVDVHRCMDRFGTLRRVVPEHRAYVPAHVHERDLICELVVFNHVALLCTEGTEPGFQPHRGGV